jgi:hypothetical protein
MQGIEPFLEDKAAPHSHQTNAQWLPLCAVFASDADPSEQFSHIRLSFARGTLPKSLRMNKSRFNVESMNLRINLVLSFKPIVVHDDLPFVSMTNEHHSVLRHHFASQIVDRCEDPNGLPCQLCKPECLKTPTDFRRRVHL